MHFHYSDAYSCWQAIKQYLFKAAVLQSINMHVYMSICSSIAEPVTIYQHLLCKFCSNKEKEEMQDNRTPYGTMDSEQQICGSILIPFAMRRNWPYP